MTTSDHPDVDDVVRTFPISDFARAMSMSEDGVRAAVRHAVHTALTTGGSIDNMRRTMEIALEAGRTRGK